jgi:hypothetical protein
MISVISSAGKGQLHAGMVCSHAPPLSHTHRLSLTRTASLSHAPPLSLTHRLSLTRTASLSPEGGEALSVLDDAALEQIRKQWLPSTIFGAAVEQTLGEWVGARVQGWYCGYGVGGSGPRVQGWYN